MIRNERDENPVCCRGDSCLGSNFVGAEVFGYADVATLVPQKKIIKKVKQQQSKQAKKESNASSKDVKKKPGVSAKTATKASSKKDKKRNKKESQKNGKKKAPRKKKKAANPLGNLFRHLFQNNSKKPIIPKNNKGKVPSKKEATAARKRLGRDRVEQQAAIQPEHIKILQRISKLIAQKKWGDAIEFIVHFADILDRTSESLFRTEKNEWRSTREELNRLIGTLPADILQKYQLKIAGTAERELTLAHKNSDIEQLSEVASRYFHSPAGHKAANELATIYLDRGSFALATYWFRALLDSHSSELSHTVWLMRAAYAFQAVGYKEGTTKVEEALKKLYPSGQIKIGERTVSLESWIRKSDSFQISPNKELEDWWMLHGDPSRLGTVVGSEPLLISRWHIPSTLSHSIRERVKLLEEDLISQQRVPIPVAQPVTIDGKIAISTFYGVQVIDANSGKLLWRTRPGISAENLLTGMNSSGDVSEQLMAMQGAVFVQRGMGLQSSATSVDFNSLTGYLYRNGSHGMISSDGAQLFVVEDQALFIPNRNYYGWGQDPSSHDPYGRDWKSNKIAAYNLKTGRPTWEIGGKKFNEPFDRPLAGYYFFGPPVAVGDELYVIGEKDDEISLVSLDPVSGQKNWSHLLAYSDVKIQQDTLRRFSYIQPSVGEGIIVCPTTSGWILGLDKQNRSIVWAHRYSKLKKKNKRNNSFRGYNNYTPIPALNTRWIPSAPIVSSGRVVYTPLEEPILECLSLFDGRRLWKIDKKKALYLAGVFKESVVVVEKKAIKAYHLKDGKIRWTLPIKDREDFPAGRGTAVGNFFYLPLHSGQLWAIDIKTGKVTAKQFLTEHRESNLGNLLMYRGMLLSTNALGMTAYEQKDVLTRKIRERKTQNPNDGWALLKEAEIALSKKEYSKSLGFLHRIPKKQPRDLDRPLFRKTLLYTLSSLVSQDLKNADKYLAELSRESQTDAEKFSYLRLKAESFDAKGKPDEAIRVLWRLRTIPYESLERRDITNVRIPKIRWLAGRLTELWQKLSNESRQELDQSLFADVFSQGKNKKKRLQENMVLMRFHPNYLSVVEQTIRNHIGNKKYLEAETEILRLIHSSSKPAVAEIGFGLAKSLHKAGFPVATRRIFSELQTRFPKVTRDAGTSLNEQIASFLKANKIASAPKFGEFSSWGQEKLKLKKSGTNYSSNISQPMDTSEIRHTDFRNYRFEINPYSRFVMTNVQKERMKWLFPLSTPSRNSQYRVAFSFGHGIVFLYGDLIYCVSPLEKRILWYKPIEEFNSQYSTFRSVAKRTVSPMIKSNVLGEDTQSSNSGTHLLLSRSNYSGMLPVVNSNYIAAYGNRRLIVMDSLTGRVKWTYERLKSHYRVVGLKDYVLLVPTRNRVRETTAKKKTQTIVLRAFDGKKVALKNIDRYVRHAVDKIQNDLIVAETKTRGFSFLKKHETTISRKNVETGKTMWKKTFNQKTRLARLNGGYLGVLTGDGEFQFVDLYTGKMNSFPQIPTKTFKKYRSFHVLSDPASIYLIMNRSSQNISSNRFYFNSGTLSSIAVQGTMIAYDRKTSTIRWKQAIKQASLLTDQFQHSPLLVFSSQKYERVQGLGFGYAQQALLAIDKKTGKKLYDHSFPTNYGTLQQLRINLRDRYVELKSYNERIRLQVSKTTTLSKSKPRPTDTNGESKQR